MARWAAYYARAAALLRMCEGLSQPEPASYHYDIDVTLEGFYTWMISYLIKKHAAGAKLYAA